MIKQIKLNNLLSHKETVLNLHEGVNALKGESASGKTNVFLGLDWFFTNRPLGNEMRSWAGGDTQVEVLTSEGIRVGRIRSDTKNYYYINEEKLNAPGNGPPPQQVLDILNLTEVNFKHQKAPAFLISSNSGEVAKYLNKTANLEVIDEAISSIASTLKKEKGILKTANSDQEQLEENLKQYEWIKEAESELIKLTKLEHQIAGMNTQWTTLKKILGDIEIAEDNLKKITPLLEARPKIIRLIKLRQQIEIDDIEYGDLKSTVYLIEKAEKDLEKANKTLVAVPEINRLKALEKQIGIDNKKYEDLSTTISLIEQAEKDLEEVNKTKAAIPEINKLEELQQQIKEGDNQATIIDNILINIEEVEKELDQVTPLLNALPEIDRLIALQNVIVDKRNKAFGIRVIIEEIELKEESLKETKSQFTYYKKQLDELMPDICPLCEQEIS